MFTDGLDDDLKRLKKTSEFLHSRGKCIGLPSVGLPPPTGTEALSSPDGTGLYEASCVLTQCVGLSAHEADAPSPSSYGPEDVLGLRLSAFFNSVPDTDQGSSDSDRTSF